MTVRIPLIVLTPLVLLLAACGPAGSPVVQDDTSSSSQSPAPSPSPTEEPPPLQALDPASFRLEGDGEIGSTDELWFGSWGFFTDETKTVWCVIKESSEAPGRVLCQIIFGNESDVTYAVQAQVSDQCNPESAIYRDGYEVGLGLFQSIGVDSGFFGCRELQLEHEDWVATTQVLPDYSIIAVDEFSCSVIASVARCDRPAGSGSLEFGLSVATFAN